MAPLKTTVRICGRTFSVVLDPKEMNSEVSIYDNDAGVGKIVIGAAGLEGTPTEVAIRLVHEIVEAVLIQGRRRFTPWTRAGDGEATANHLFVFDHNFLDDFAAYLVDALLSTGYFALQIPKTDSDAASRSRTSRRTK